MTNIRFYQGQRLIHARGKIGTATRPVAPHRTVYVLWDGEHEEDKCNPECVEALEQDTPKPSVRDAWAERQVEV